MNYTVYKNKIKNHKFSNLQGLGFEKGDQNPWEEKRIPLKFEL